LIGGESGLGSQQPNGEVAVRNTPQMRFKGKLGMFNMGQFKTTKNRVNYLAKHFPPEDPEDPEDDQIDANDLEQLTSWLMLEISGIQDEVDAAWEDLLKFIMKNQDEFEKLSEESIQGTDAWQIFSLRRCGFAIFLNTTRTSSSRFVT
jgi:hypothetical protein